MGKPARRRSALACVLGAVVLCGMLAGCVVAPEPAPEAPEAEAAPALPLEQLAAFSGIAAMNAGSNCSGTLIDTGTASGPAYVLTNGHCTGDVGRPAQQTTLGIEWGGTAEFLRAEGYGERLTVEVVELAYSTMRHTDTAIVRLDATLGELQEFGLRAVPIAASEPAEGDAVVNVGVPVQGLDYDDWVLRRGDCTLGGQHTLIEFQWLWFGVWANDCPGIIQGSSGSPLLSVDADGEPREIVGLINTTSVGSTAAMGGACWLNRPCQVTADGAVMVEGTSYAQSVAGMGSCFDAQGLFAIGGDCPLPVSSIWAEGSGGSFRGGGEPDSTGRVPSTSFVGAEAGEARTALVPIGDATACLEPATYAGAALIDLPAGGEVWEQLGVPLPVDLPTEEGRFMVCAVAGDDYAGAASQLFAVDRTPPVAPAGAVVEDAGDGAVIVWPRIDPPEVSTVRFIWGDADELDCDDTASFQEFFTVPLFLAADELPVRYCVYGLDEAGNRTEVEIVDIEGP